MNSKNKINVLLYSMGTLNQALIRNFKKSSLLDKIFILNGNLIKEEKVISLGYGSDTTIGEHKKIIKDNNIDFVIINSEIYLFDGFINFYKKIINLPAIGADKKWFLLEASKKYCKKFMLENDIKTPDYAVIYDTKSIDEYIDKFGLPLVIKYNNLYAGFGSYICYTKKDCIKRINQVFDLTKKNTTPFCIVEKYIKGSEISVHYAWDGNTLIPLIPVKDFKKFSAEEKSLNTGGMGSFAPVVLSENQNNMLEAYNKKLEKIFQKLKPDFCGIFVVNLLFTNKEIYTLEFNMRPGITEFETLIELFDFDLLEFYYNLAIHQLNKCEIKYKKGVYAGCVTVTHKNFCKRNNKFIKLPLKEILPENNNNLLINNCFTEIDEKNKVKLNEKNKFYTILNVDKNNPFNAIYDYLKNIKNSKVYYRKDLGEIFSKQKKKTK